MGKTEPVGRYFGRSNGYVKKYFLSYPGIGAIAEEKLWNAGIHDWDDWDVFRDQLNLKIRDHPRTVQPILDLLI
jgi:hypothetical protein